MKKVKFSRRLLLVALLSLSISLPSCMTTRTNVGAYKEKTGDVYTYARGKQVWLFWGIVPLRRTHVSTPVSKDCQVVTKFSLGDFLISGLTGGLVMTESIKVLAKKEKE